MTQSSGMAEAAHPPARGVGIAVVTLNTETRDPSYSQGEEL